MTMVKKKKTASSSSSSLPSPSLSHHQVIYICIISLMKKVKKNYPCVRFDGGDSDIDGASLS